jgi:hypothetical protein
MFKKVLNLLFPTKLKRSISSDYLINDPSTPGLVEKTKHPSVGNLKFQVKDLDFSPKNADQKRALNSYITIGNFLNYIQENAKSPIKRWASTDVLNVNCLAGKDLNAFYDRHSLRFYYERKGLKTIFMADSADIVSHELGHAILDAMRPDFWSVQSHEIWAFHEAFSDICSIVNIMQHEIVLKMAIEQTNNDLFKSNIISRLAEEVGIFVYENYSKTNGYLTNALRDAATEIYTYKSSDKLPEDAPNNQLSSECHSYGRVFLSVWYNILCKIYIKQLESNPPIVALKNARDISFFMLLQAIPISPRVVEFHSALATCMVSIAKMKYPEYTDIVKNSFIEWKILKNNTIKMLSNTTRHEVILNLNKNDQVLKNSKGAIVRLSRQKTLKIENLSILSNNKLNNVEVEIPADLYFSFNEKGVLIDEIIPDDQDILNSTISCLSYVEKTQNDMWKVKNNKLLRNFII